MTGSALKKVSSRGEDGWDWESARERCLREARRVLRSHAAAEDAAQEAVVRAWTKRAACRAPERRGAWLAAIAHREALRVLSRERRGQSLPLEEDLLAIDADPQQLGVERRLAISRIVSSLPAAQRDLVYLRYVKDCQYSDIAKRLAIPEGTVKVRLHRLHRRLQAVLGPFNE